MTQNKNLRILTFDIEDWYHLLDLDCTKNINDWGFFESRISEGVDKLLDVCTEYEIKATFFCLGWIAKRHPNLIKKIDSLGFEIGSHSFSHGLVYKQTPKFFREDVKLSLDIIENITGKKIRYFRAPGFSITSKTPWAFEELINLGIEFDSSIFPNNRSHGGYNGFGSDSPCLVKCKSGVIKEFPINLGCFFGKKIVFSGGGYFRLLPYPLINYYFKRSNYVMSYFHPRDFDPNQPVLELSPIRKFKSYIGINGSYHKLKNLLADYEFIDLSSASQLICWRSVPTIDIVDSKYK